MTTTIAENAVRDWYAGTDGNLVFISDAPGNAIATAQLCKSRIEAQRNEMVYSMNEGMPTRATAWDQFNPKQFEAAARAIISGTPNVIQIVSFDMFKNGNALDYAAVIQTTYGTATVNPQ